MDNGKKTVLVVDDMEINREILVSMLEGQYEVRQAADGVNAIGLMFSGAVAPDIVLLDIMMPEMDGLQVLEMMRSNPVTKEIPVIIISAAGEETVEIKGLALGAVDFVAKPFRPEVVKVRIANQLIISAYRTSLEEMVRVKVNQLTRTKEKMMETMANVIEYRNLESGAHVKRTAGMTRILLDHICSGEGECAFDAADRDVIVKAVPLHDIGKIAIPDKILLKPGPLDKEEFEIMKTHAAIGSDIINMMLNDDDDARYKKHCYDISRHHHERWDGKGYPDGLAGADIPLPARILTVADVYDALVSPRCYKPAMSHKEAADIIAGGAGSQFDPDVANAFLAVQERFEHFDREHFQ
ncbi:MAG: response regulator [Oscillospiraceae bacterium]|jgi:putative two-component system response regulator|nr:response regulator [Oscillospiraceae bacterium]